jgi:glycosyltransferase involved in cell wall biosynthesis
MACGVPVVATNRSSVPEIVQDTGLLVDPHDPEELARAMQAILAAPGRRGEITEKAMARAQFFSWEKMVREVLEIYREVIESKTRNATAAVQRREPGMGLTAT